MTTSNLFGTKMPIVPHLAQAGASGLKGEIGDLRKDVEEAFVAMQNNGALMQLDVFTNLAAADDDAIMTSFDTSDAEQSFTADDFDGAVGAAEMVPPRNITITSSDDADVDGVAVVITGFVRDRYGKLIAQTDTINVTNNGDTQDVGTKAFSLVTGIDIPAMSGDGGSLQIGFGVVVGLSKPIRSAAGRVMSVQEITDGSLVTNGTFVAAETATPNGTWSPNTAANGAHDYAILYLCNTAA